MSSPIYQPRSDSSARLLGLGFLSAGAGMIYWQGILPLSGAMEHRPLIEYSIKLIVLGEMFVCLGLFWMIRGLAAYTAVRAMQQNPRAMKKLVVVSLIAALLSWWLVEWHVV